MSAKKEKAGKGGIDNTLFQVHETSIPIVLKKDAWKKDVLICQNHDASLNFTGDSGAVGRLTVVKNSESDSGDGDPAASGRGKLIVDLKGRQYSGQIMAGPIVMILNLTQPVVSKAKPKPKKKDEEGENEDKSKAEVKEDEEDEEKAKAMEDTKKPGVVARVEVVTNEFCQLEFLQDMEAKLKGEYKGEMEMDELQEGDSELALRRNAPKISTVTTKKRAPAKKKGGASKRAKTK
mgnify:CR=1 FL=1